jgi:hypothetical protein
MKKEDDTRDKTRAIELRMGGEGGEKKNIKVREEC